MLNRTRTKELFQRAKKTFPYGVNSNFRYWGEDHTSVIVRGEKCYVFDADENRYIDYRLGFGPVILGHGYPAVVERITRAIKDGGVYAATHPLEIIVAERIARMTGMDKVRLVNSGTEATMHALRIARAHTNREKFIKFEGAYHGMHDNVLFSTSMSLGRTFGSRRSPVQVASGSGIPRALNEYVITLAFNDPEMLHKTLKAKWGDIAAILIEPIMGNAAGLMPQLEFLQTIRRVCDEYGIVMIMDEVKTGFRIANGGAQEYFGVKADLATYAKALANGYPLAAIAGMDEVMSVIEPGKVSLGGTYCGNIPGAAAADATLEILEKDEPDDQSLIHPGEEWVEIPIEDPLEILEDPSIALELSEDPVRLYLKEIGQIHLLDADSEFRLATQIEAKRQLAAFRQRPVRKGQGVFTAAYHSLLSEMTTSWNRLGEDAPAAARPGPGERPRHQRRRTAQHFHRCPERHRDPAKGERHGDFRVRHPRPARHPGVPGPAARVSGVQAGGGLDQAVRVQVRRRRHAAR